MESPLVKLGEWKPTDLRGKTVEFKFASEDGDVSGVGKFLVSAVNSKGFCRVEIASESVLFPKKKGKLTKYHIPQDSIALIRRHPEPEIANFLLV